MKNDILTKHETRNTKKPPKIAIVTNWITGVGGAERVIYQLHRAFPEAPIYTATYEPKGSTLFKGADIRTSWMQKLPTPLRKHQLLTIPRQWYFGHLKLKGYDLVISAGSSEEKAVRAPDGKHVNICYTPTLQYWVKPDNYLKKGADSVNLLWRLGLRILMPYVRLWDLKASKRPDTMLAISTEVQKRIKKYYGRRSDILYPPCDIERFTNEGRAPRDGFVTFGRQVTHKRFDLAIQACNEANKKLVVIGDGPEHGRLKAMAGPTIEFKTNVSDAQMVEFVSRAEAFIFPNEEDFGIVAVEAQASGIPVIAYRAGGALDTVTEGVTGEFFDEQTVSCLADTLKNFNYKLYNRAAILENANKFSSNTFRDKLLAYVNGIS
ncbi:glycosyltransferase [Candidatus Saccharibacteria bacterium]|nr:glycosyltransferase [Candidatus Saccharibacteria bacterium]